MSKEIINRVANSKIITIDLEDYYPQGKRHLLDIKNFKKFTDQANDEIISGAPNTK